MPCFQWRRGYKGQDLILSLHVHPASKKDQWCGLYGNALKVKIKAPPIDGKANEYLIKWLATEFQVKQSAITLLKGHQSPNKQIKIASPTCIPEPITQLGLFPNQL